MGGLDKRVMTKLKVACFLLLPLLTQGFSEAGLFDNLLAEETDTIQPCLIQRCEPVCHTASKDTTVSAIHAPTVVLPRNNSVRLCAPDPRCLAANARCRGSIEEQQRASDAKLADAVKRYQQSLAGGREDRRPTSGTRAGTKQGEADKASRPSSSAAEGASFKTSATTSVTSVVRSISDLKAAAWHANNVYINCPAALEFWSDGAGYASQEAYCFDSTASDMALEEELEWGFVDSVAKTAVKTVKKTVVDPVKKTVVDPGVAAVKAAVVDPVKDALDSSSAWLKGVVESNGVQRYIATKGDTAMVAFRGTDASGDWLTNINTAEADWHYAGESVKVHNGFYTQYSWQRADLIKHMQALYDSGIKHFIVTGHSLGGALAQLGAYDLSHYFSAASVDLYTFAPPRPSQTSSAFQSNLKKVVEYQAHVTYKEDIVPCTPPGWDPQANLRHWTGSVWESTDHCDSGITGFVSQLAKYISSIRAQPDVSGGDHSMGFHCSAVGAICGEGGKEHENETPGPETPGPETPAPQAAQLLNDH